MLLRWLDGDVLDEQPVGLDTQNNDAVQVFMARVA